MKRPNLLFFAIVPVALFFLSSCGGSHPSDPGDLLSGVLSGHVALHDEYGRKLSDHSGAIISLRGTSYSTTTNAEGYWKFDDLPQGTYIVGYTKEGFSERRLYSIAFVGGGHHYLNTMDIDRLPSYSITNFNAYVTDTTHQVLSLRIGDTAITDTGVVVTRERDTMVTKVVTGKKRVVIEGEIDQVVPQGLGGRIALVCGNQPSVSRTHGEHIMIVTAYVEGNGSQFAYVYPLDEFLDRNSLQQGMRLYIVAHPSSLDIPIYDEPERRTPIHAYMTPNASPVVDVVLQ